MVFPGITLKASYTTRIMDEVAIFINVSIHDNDNPRVVSDLLQGACNI